MIVAGKSVIGLRVLTINDGKQIETIDDIIYDPAKQKVEALIVNSGGLFSEAKAISIADVTNIGTDAVMVQSQDVIKPVSELSERVSHIAESDNNLVKTRVVTQDGTELGKVTDIVFDSMDGSVKELEVSQGGVKNIGTGKKRVRPEDIITVGADATIVSSFTEDRFDEQAREGGVAGVLNNAKEKVAEVASTATDKAQELTETAKDKGNELKDKTQQKVEDVKNDAGNQEKFDSFKVKAAELKDLAGTKLDEAKDKAEEMKDSAASKVSDAEDTADDKIQEAKSDRSAEFKVTTPPQDKVPNTGSPAIEVNTTKTEINTPSS